MSEWIKNAAERLKRRREEEKKRLGRGLASAKALHSDAPMLWNKLSERIEGTAADFNKQFTDDPLCPQPVHFESFRHSVALATVYCNSNSPTYRLIVTFLEERAVVACSLRASDHSRPPVAGPPAELQFRVSDGGQVEIYQGDKAISMDEAVRSIVEPLFDSVELIAY